MSSTIQRGLPSGDTPARPPGYEDSPGVREALTAVDGGRPVVLITGRAGTGKTTLVHHLRERAGGEAQAVVAPTGVAALNARAQTIHSFFQFPFGVLDAPRRYSRFDRCEAAPSPRRRAAVRRRSNRAGRRFSAIAAGGRTRRPPDPGSFGLPEPVRVQRPSPERHDCRNDRARSGLSP